MAGIISRWVTMVQHGVSLQHHDTPWRHAMVFYLVRGGKILNLPWWEYYHTELPWCTTVFHYTTVVHHGSTMVYYWFLTMVFHLVQSGKINLPWWEWYHVELPWWTCLFHYNSMVHHETSWCTMLVPWCAKVYWNLTISFIPFWYGKVEYIHGQARLS